jgi:hypothetical protein
MKMKLLVFVSFAVSLCAQGVRFDSQATTISGSVPTGAYAPVLAVPGAVISVCANANCTIAATTYNSSALTTSCPTSAPLTAPGSTLCVSTTGQNGAFGFWYPLSNVWYKIRLPNGTTYGPFALSAGIATSVASPTTSVQFNNSGVFGGSANFTYNSTGSGTLNLAGSENIAGNLTAGTATVTGALTVGSCTGCSGSPGGSIYQVQTNNGSGGFAGSSGFTYANGQVAVSGTTSTALGSFTQSGTGAAVAVGGQLAVNGTVSGPLVQIEQNALAYPAMLITGNTNSGVDVADFEDTGKGVTVHIGNTNIVAGTALGVYSASGNAIAAETVSGSYVADFSGAPVLIETSGATQGLVIGTDLCTGASQVCGVQSNGAFNGAAADFENTSPGQIGLYASATGNGTSSEIAAQFEIFSGGSGSYSATFSGAPAQFNDGLVIAGGTCSGCAPSAPLTYSNSASAIPVLTLTNSAPGPALEVTTGGIIWTSPTSGSGGKPVCIDSGGNLYKASGSSC